VINLKSKLRNRKITIPVGFAIIYLLMIIPGPEPVPPKPEQNRAFAWNQDERWHEIESRFVEVKTRGCEYFAGYIDSTLSIGRQLVDSLNSKLYTPESPIFTELEANTFESGALVAACPEKLTLLMNHISAMRTAIKRQSRNWNLDLPETHQRIYRLLYGARAAIEEVMLQAPENAYRPLIPGIDELSETPYATVLGVTIHSGDILISRGGVATSALIARGNDYPGNFSHVALVYVDPKTSLISVIESHIECGMTVSPLDKYLEDKKLRIMILRVRSDIPQMLADPFLPHKAAQSALDDFKAGHIAYDFAMDLSETKRRFCSEIASVAYAQFGIQLWGQKSTISSIGTRRWLAMFGVRHFESEAPSDLEYDPQVQVVAEWRDPETLYKDHIYSAVTDIMIEDGDKGESIYYPIYFLPITRLVKIYSLILNQFGIVGPIPEGMDARAALRNRYFTKHHKKIADLTYQLAAQFKKDNGYTPPYWEIVKLARQAKDSLQNSLSRFM
jgi:hypothetical protein